MSFFSAGLCLAYYYYSSWCAGLSSVYSFFLSSPPLSYPWPRKLFPQGLPSPSLTIPWSPFLQSLLPSPSRPLTVPPGYAAWGSMMITLVVKILTTERYFGVSTPALHSLHFVLAIVCCHLLNTQFLSTWATSKFHTLPLSKPPFVHWPTLYSVFLHQQRCSALSLLNTTLT